jgi:hypothetical protein
LVSSEPNAEFSIGSTIAGRFVVESALDGKPGRAAFLGREASTGEVVVLLELDAVEAAALEKAKSVEHAHLERVLEIASLSEDRRVLVAAYVAGETLEQRLAQVGKKEPVDAVRSALRIADALTALHEAGASHGFVHAGSVVLEPEHKSGPVLGFAPIPEEPAMPELPGRSSGAPPTPADDAWATGVLFHRMLLGSLPPASGYSSQDDVPGVGDPALKTALFHALAADPQVRGQDMRPLRRELARWFVDHAGEEPIAPGRHSREPPPLPPSLRPATSARPKSTISIEPRRRSKRVLVIALVAVGAGLVAGSVASMLRPKRVEVIAVPSTPVVESAAAIDLGDIPVTGESDKLVGSKLAACVAGYLPEKAFDKAPDLGSFCAETDPRKGAEKLRIAIVAGAPKGQGPTDAMKIFARLGWYEMAAFAVIRAGCCPDATALSLPEAKAECAIIDSLKDLGETVSAVKPIDEPLKRYTEAIHCEVNKGGGRALGRSGRPVGGEDTAFLELVKRLQ